MKYKECKNCGNCSDKQTLNEALREIFNCLNLSIPRVANEMNCDPKTLHEIINGNSKVTEIFIGRINNVISKRGVAIRRKSE